MNDRIKYWIELSEYDMLTAIAMYESGRYLYVGFMCHQVIEKIIKAYFVKLKQETPPFTHSLSSLVQKVELSDQLDEKQKNLISMLEPLNIEARYPTKKDKLFNYLTKERCIDLISQTKELFEWIKMKL